MWQVFLFKEASYCKQNCWPLGGPTVLPSSDCFLFAPMSKGLRSWEQVSVASWKSGEMTKSAFQRAILEMFGSSLPFLYFPSFPPVFDFLQGLGAVLALFLFWCSPSSQFHFGLPQGTFFGKLHATADKSGRVIRQATVFCSNGESVLPWHAQIPGE